MRSVMQHDFSKAPQATIPRSSFNRTCGGKTTFDAGFLIPIFIEEVLPGDTLNLKMTAFARLATPLHPFMDNLFLDSFFFFVPNRLLWDNWQKFNGEQANPADTTDYLIPTITSPVGGHLAGEIYDYFGIPTLVPGLVHSALWPRAYNLIYNEWFRDQNLQDSLPVPTGDGPDDPTNYKITRRGKRHDYFTSALPWPQKGPSVALPLSGNAPVTGIGIQEGQVPQNTTGNQLETGGAVSYGQGYELHTQTGYAKTLDGTTGALPQIFADLSAVAAATINELREAFQVQKLYERDARGGTRYTEIIRAHFGVTSPDARLQRPEYLGGGSTPVNVNPVAQTSETTVGTPQGNLAAFGTATINNHGFTKSFTEHGVIIGMICARADLNYQQGLNRMWSRSTRFDFYWPALAHIGEQAILNKEIFAQGSDDATADAAAFGYQERFAEYRYKPSLITGQFRSNFAQSLDSWHLAQDFGTLPTLNDTFIQETPPVDRVVAVTAEPDFLLDTHFSYRCARPMPMYGVPGLIDHF